MASEAEQQFWDIINEIEVLHRLSTGIPAGTMSHILGYVVALRCPHVHLKNDHPLAYWATVAIGEHEVTRGLMPQMEFALVEPATMSIVLNLVQRGSAAPTQLPRIVTTLPKQTRYLKIDCFIGVPFPSPTSLPYPNGVDDLVPMVAELKARLPNLHPLTLRLQFVDTDLSMDPRMERLLSKQYTNGNEKSPTSLLALAANLLQTVKKEGPGKKRWLQVVLRTERHAVPESTVLFWLEKEASGGAEGMLQAAWPKMGFLHVRYELKDPDKTRQGPESDW